MADKKDKDVEKAESAETTEATSETQEQKEGEQLLAGKFKDVNELASSYVDLQSKLGEMGDKLGTMEQYMANTNSILQNLNSRTQPQEQSTTSTEATTEEVKTDPRVDQMEQTLRYQSILDYMKRHNIPEDKAQETNAKVGKELQSLGYDVRTAPVDMLPGLLDRGYKLAYGSEQSENSRQEGAAQTMANMQSSLPPQGSGNVNEEGKVELTPQQKEWQKKINPNIDEKRQNELLKKYPEK